MAKPLISVIIPIYNVEQYLRQCLDSLVNQTLKDIEIICVNDGSPDKSIDILNEYKEKDNRIVVINQMNSGVSIARNKGISIACGEFLMFVDGDDWVDTSMCEKLYKTATDENADCVMCSYQKEFEDHSVNSHIFNKDRIVLKGNDVKNNFHRQLFGLVGDELSNPQNGDIIVSPCMQLFKIDVCKNVEFIDIKEICTFEDGLYQIGVYENCDTFVYIDEPLYHYRKTNEQSLTTKYRPDLFEKWQHLFDIMQGIIDEKKYDKKYNEALNNRIALSMIGLGLNEISAKDKSISKKARRLKQILKTERYEKAYKQLKIQYMPFQWKVFFLLCKYKMTHLLVLMLECIEFLRKRVK